MITNEISLKTINDLLKSKYEFYIPSYQRGYRWNRQQIKDLLSDIWEFHLKNPAIDEFYCLQPIVVKPKSVDGREKWEVIDGQQRLTTIYIILQYIKQNILPKVDLSFSLEYETRPNSKKFLDTMDSSIKDNNIDFFYMYSAFDYIKEWFESKEDETTAGISIYDKLRNQTKIIWYQINDNSDPISIFTRINLGKIPLTNAELVKALFLKQDNFADNTYPDKIRLKQIEIASEWDRIEYALQNDEFWYFLNNGLHEYETRIEFIFDMMARQINNLCHVEKRIKKENNEYFSFLVFNQLFEEEEEKNKKNKNSKEMSIENLWTKIKRYYMTFEEWFNERELYHLIGYLVSIANSIEGIKNETEKMSKAELRAYLKNKIRSSLNLNKKVEDLDYENNKAKIKELLLLFNIVSLQINDKSNMRFPFDRYKMEKWDIEHIHAVNTKMPSDKNNRLEWLLFAKEKVDDEIIVNNISDFIDNKDLTDNLAFENLFSEILKKYGEDDDVNDITNLTLLDSRTNRSYKNAVFPVKRKVILENDRNGTFIPLCTKNVFLKYYSEDIDQMNYWGREDRKKYLEAILAMLSDFVPKQ